MDEANTRGTRATLRLPHLDIEIVHRQGADGRSEQLLLRAEVVPSLEAFGRALALSNPWLVLANPWLWWTGLVQAGWPWLPAAVRSGLPWDQSPRTAPDDSPGVEDPPEQRS
jgi:hypothetical protein